MSMKDIHFGGTFCTSSCSVTTDKLDLNEGIHNVITTVMIVLQDVLHPLLLHYHHQNEICSIKTIGSLHSLHLSLDSPRTEFLKFLTK